MSFMTSFVYDVRLRAVVENNNMERKWINISFLTSTGWYSPNIRR